MKNNQHGSSPLFPHSLLVWTLLGALAMASNAMANPSPRMIWTKPASAGAGQQHHHGHQPGQQAQPQPRRRGGPKRLRLVNGEGASVALWRPDLSSDPLPLGQDGTVVFTPKVDNYHAVVAERKGEGLQEASIRYEYMRGKPSDQSPSRLARAQKTDFEIEPVPIPREHYRYLANYTWDFTLRFRGEPLSGIPVVLETSHGSRVETTADEDGLARFTIPDDFPAIRTGRRNNPPAELMVFAQHEAGGLRYETTLSAPYHVDPGHWRSQGWGLAVAGLGLVAGGFIGGIGRRNGGKA